MLSSALIKEPPLQILLKLDRLSFFVPALLYARPARVDDNVALERKAGATSAVTFAPHTDRATGDAVVADAGTPDGRSALGRWCDVDVATKRNRSQPPFQSGVHIRDE